MSCHQGCLHLAGLQQALGLEPSHFNVHHVPLEWRCASLLDPGTHQRALPDRRGDQIVTDGELAKRADDLAVFHAHVGRKQALSVGNGPFGRLDFSLRDGDASRSPKQIQRPLHFDPGLIVGAGRLLLLHERYGRIRA